MRRDRSRDRDGVDGADPRAPPRSSAAAARRDTAPPLRRAPSSPRRTAQASWARGKTGENSRRGSAPSSRGRRRRSERAAGFALCDLPPNPHAVSPLRSSERGVRAEQTQIEAERPAAHVGDVEVERLAEGRPRSRRHLPESGQAGGQEKPLEVMGLVDLRLVGQAGPRADERHVSAEHVEQLGQLVGAQVAQQLSDPRHGIRSIELVEVVRARRGVRGHDLPDVLRGGLPRRSRFSSCGT